MSEQNVEYARNHEFFVRTPIGLIRVCSNTTAKKGSDRPAIFVEFVNCEGNIPMATIEYDPNQTSIITKVFGDMYENEPTQIVQHKDLDLLWDGV